ncbi:MAG: diguanylate cyclase [Gammaproteobacteria bacterium]|nr:diguanylate cyclase [Gammaproteobacteria bacterium]MDH5651393.1 diguanylate cyclase [Gammaproteobacteria bacterium]
MNQSQEIAGLTDQTKPNGLVGDISLEIYREQVMLLFRQFQLAFITIVLIAPLFVVYINKATNSDLIIFWLFAFWAVNLIRYYHCHHVLSQDPQTINYKKAENFFLSGTAASGLLWGAAAAVFYPAENHVAQIFIFFTIAGLSGGAVSSLSSRPAAFRLLLFPMTVPFVIKLFTLGDEASLMMAAMLSLYIVALTAISSRSYNSLYESLQLRLEKAELQSKYRQLQTDTARTNSSLQSELERHRSRQQSLQINDAFLQSILITASDGIIISDDQGIIISVNHAIERDFGFSERELIGKSINIIMTQKMGPKHDAYMKAYLTSNSPSMVGRMIEVPGQKKDGTIFPIEITVSEARIDNRIYFTGIIRDISKRKQDEAKLQMAMEELQLAKQELEFTNTCLVNSNTQLLDQSQHDELTDLANRRYLMKTMKHEWFRCQRNRNPLSVILLDIDFFKAYNDEYGHQAGDDCLVRISKAIRQQLSRSSDFVARYGGEEFIAVIPETDMEGAYYLANQMRQAVVDLAIPHGKSTISNYVTISGGVATTVPTQEFSCEMLINAADQALYSAKSSGRNKIRKAAQDKT